MTAEALEPVHRRKGRLQSFDHFERADPAEVASGDHRQEIEPEICRRRAVGDDRLGGFLEIVGREHVILRPDEGVEEAPSVASDQAEGVCLGRRHRHVPGYWRRKAGPASDGR